MSITSNSSNTNIDALIAQYEEKIAICRNDLALYEQTVEVLKQQQASLRSDDNNNTNTSTTSSTPPIRADRNSAYLKDILKVNEEFYLNNKGDIWTFFWNGAAFQLRDAPGASKDCKMLFDTPGGVSRAFCKRRTPKHEKDTKPGDWRHIKRKQDDVSLMTIYDNHFA